jgi:leader peptidase (prepilin peptidase)/N-methyltransferase
MLFLILLIGVAGLILGSFLNVVIYRLPRGESLMYPGSHCISCNKPVAFYDNIPVISFLLLRGRCRHCGTHISWRYPLVESITAFLLIALFLRYGLTSKMLAYGIMTLFLIPISFIDLEKNIIPNKLTISGFIVAIGLILGLHIENWKEVLLGIIAGGGILLLFGWIGKILFKKESMGMGDVKLLIMIGACVGFPEVLFSLYLGIVIAAVFIIGAMILRKLRFGDTIPFGPFIAVGTMMFLLRGQVILNWYLNLYNR